MWDNLVPTLPAGFRYHHVTTISSDHTSSPAVMIAIPINLSQKLMSFTGSILQMFVESCGEDQWKLLNVESPEVEKKKEKLTTDDNVNSEAESNEPDEESSSEVEDVAEFDLNDLSVRYWTFLLLNLASHKTTVSFFFWTFINFFSLLSKLFLVLKVGSLCWHFSFLFLKVVIWEPHSQTRLSSMLLTKMITCLVSLKKVYF